MTKISPRAADRDSQFLNLPQTHFLSLGLLLNYLGLILWLGLRRVVVISGGVLAVLTLLIGWWQWRSAKPIPQANNLLDLSIFQNHLDVLTPQIPECEQTLWAEVQQQAVQIQQIVARLVSKDATLLSDLLETLHTVLDLVEHIAEILQIRQTILTTAHHQLASQHLTTCLSHLHQTYEQLQELQSQTVVQGLKRFSGSGLSSHLQTIVAINQDLIHQDLDNLS